MAIETGDPSALPVVAAFALVGALGVGSQWIAWQLRMPAIVLMLAAGLLVGPVFGVFDPARDIGPLLSPLISIAVAVILFEGGLTLSYSSLSGAADGVKRLVFLGAPLGWLASTLACHYGAGLSWEASAVFGGIMIVTGPTVIAPLLRQAKLSKRPAALLQWEAILNDPVGALAAVLAFEVVAVRYAAENAGDAALQLILGIGFATLVGLGAGFGVARAFKAGGVPEYMKVPVLVAVLLAAFAVADLMLHESGLLAVTIMGVVLANAHLPSYAEIRRFKEYATILLVSGVFILLAANLDVATLGTLDWRAVLFVGIVILVARPGAVLLALMGSKVAWRERLLVAFTGPRGVVLVAVAGLFGERLVQMGIEDGAAVGALAFVLVAVTVVLHGFTLGPLARVLRLRGAEKPGVLLVGGSNFTTALAQALNRAEVPVTIADPNPGHLRPARKAGLGTFGGDILSEAAEHRLDFIRFSVALAATDNDAYNTLVATDLAHEIGRDNTWQVAREKADDPRHQLPPSLGGRSFADGETFGDWARKMVTGRRISVVSLEDEQSSAAWVEANPEAQVIGAIGAAGAIRFRGPDEALPGKAGGRLIAVLPPEEKR